MKKLIIYLAVLSSLVFLFLITSKFGLIASLQSVTNDNEKSAASLCVMPPANMVTWLPGDGNANDIIGGNNGTLRNGASFAVGKVEQSFELDGINDFIELPTSNLNFGTNDFSLELWFNLSAVSDEHTLFNKLSGGRFPNSQEYLLEANHGRLRFVVRDTTANENDLEIDPSLQANTWYHVVAVRNGNTNLLFLNGVLIGQQTAGTNVNTGTGGVAYIGRLTASPSRFFGGKIDEFSIYNRALSQPEIQAVFDAGSAGKCNSLCVSPPSNIVAWYPGDDNANDIIGGNNGTLQNGATFAAGKVGQAFSFDGIDDYAEFSDRSSLDISENLTIDVWIKPSVPLSQQADYARLVDKLNFTEQPPTGYTLFTNGNSSSNPGKLCFEFWGINGTQANVCTIEPDLAPISSFTHVTGVYNQSSGIMRLYVNGQEKGTANVGTLTISTNNVPLRFGNAINSFSNDFFKGIIDEVSIYNQALSQSEVQGIFDAGNAGKCKPFCVSPPANIIAWYPGDGNAADIVGGNNGNWATFEAGKVERAFSFNGSNGISIPSTPALNSTEAITLSSWVKPTSYPNDYPTIIRKQTDNQQNVQYLIALSGIGQAHCNIGGFAGLVGGSIPLNQWSHVACSYDRQIAVLYVNGIPVASGNFTAPIPVANTNLGIGTTDFPDRNFNGLIDEVSIYSRALSQSEIQAIVDAGSAGKCKPTPNDWNATSGFLPDRKCPPYNLLDTAEPENPVLSANKLTLSTSNNQTLMMYQQTAPYISFSNLTYIEARTRFVSGSSSAANRTHIGIKFTTAPNVGNILFIGLDEIFLLADGDVKGQSVAVDTNDSFHTYRINVQPNGAIDVLYDGNLLFTGTTFNNSDAHGGTPQIGWGDITTLAQGVSEWEFFRHNAGRGTPPECPPPTPDPTFIVTNTNDNGPGSFRQAILNANATPGAQTITFNIPGSGVQTIAPLSALPNITEQVTINGYTQPGASPNTLAVGNNATLLIELNGANIATSNGLVINDNANNCIVRGLVINRFFSSAAIYVSSSGNLVEGNFIGTDATGSSVLGNYFGVRIIGSTGNNTIGGITPAARNIISGNRYSEIATQFNPPGTVIQGNYIGSNAAGTAALPSPFGVNGKSNINVEGSNNIIGGSVTGAGNVIAGGGGGTGITLNTVQSFVQGNFIGTLADGITAAGFDDNGVRINGSNNTIGGLDGGAGNVIAFSNREGISVQSGSGNRIMSNSIFGNSGLGIDLGGDGITPNDAGDGDSGANNRQNFPDLTAAGNSGSDTIIEGRLNSTPKTSFTLQFFSNPTCNTSDNGEGKIFIGSTTIVTDGSGNAPFNAALPVSVASGHFITATATDSANNTSEFSPCLPGPATTPPADLQVTSLAAPTQVFTDRPFDLSWTDTNNGQRRAEGAWVDKVFLSTDNQLGGDTLLSEFTFKGSLDANQSANRIQSITIPRAAIPQNGQYHLIVVIDANNNVFEGIMEGNNFRVVPITVSRALLPDLIVEAIEAPNTAFFDQTITVRWTVKNNSNASTNASEWHDNLFLSSNRMLDGKDRQLLDVLNTTYLDAGERYIASADVRIPRGLFGNFYIIVKTDNNDEVFENNENNNMLDRAINIEIPPLPDLKVTNVIAPEETFPGGQIALTYRVENQGNRDTSPVGLPNSWVDGVYLSQDQTLNEQTDRRIGECPHAGNLAQNQGYNANCTVNTPADIAGNWYVFVKTDDRNVIYEFVNENNNSNYDRVQPGSPMLIRATPPDLIVPSVNAPTLGTAARNITVSWTVRNQGAFDAAPSWFDRIYLSDDTVFNPTTDTPLASVFHGVLAAGQEYNASAEVRLPPCISGAKYIFVMTDSGNQIFEYDPKINAEQNNTSAAQPITISLVPADLQITSISNPNTGNAGQPIQVGWTVTNNGTGATIENTWTDQIYLSPTAVFNQNTALPIGVFARQGNLSQGESYTRTENITVPNQAQGNYFVFVKTDSGDNVEECANDGNNIAAGATQININNNLPDLRISSVNPIGGTVAGSTITVNWTGQNAGNAPAQNATRRDAVYFSINDTLDANDQLLAKTIISGTLVVGASYQAQAEVTIPIVAPGNYFLIVAADEGNFVFEGQYENNNASAAVLPIVVPEVDLQISNIDAPTNAFSGQSMNVSWTVTNAGTNPTIGANWTDYVYLSLDQIFDTTDRNIGYLTRQEALSGGQSYNASLNVFVPAGLTGQWYLFVVTDRNNQIAEASENNNASSARGLNLQLTPPADLTVSSVTAPTTAMPGEQTFIQWTVQNNGANPALGLWTDSIYLSTDTAWSIDDVLIGQETHLGLNAGQSYNANLTGKLPAVNLGQYFVIVRTDVRNRVRETDETNNTGVSSGQTIVDVTQLPLGAPLNTTLVTGQERYYRTNAPADETIRFSIDGQDGSSNELFTRFGAMASRSQYDFLFNRPNEPDQEIIVPDTQAGNYFNLVRGDYVPTDTPIASEQKRGKTNEIQSSAVENVTVKAEIVPFSITSVSPNRIGDNGQVTLTLNGAKFQNGATVKLIRNSTILTADKVTVLNSATVKARFIFNNALHGIYDVVLTNPNSATVTAVQAVTIETATQMRIELDINGNTRPRAGRTMSVDGVLRNTGNIDVPYVAVRAKFGADVNVAIRRPVETLPRHSDMIGTEAEKYASTNIKVPNFTYDYFWVRDFEVGQQISFTTNVTGFGGTPFTANILAVPRSADQFLSSFRTSTEDLRKFFLKQPTLSLPPELASRVNNSQQWWELFNQNLVAMGYINFTSLTSSRTLTNNKDIPDRVINFEQEGCPLDDGKCLDAYSGASLACGLTLNPFVCYTGGVGAVIWCELDPPKCYEPNPVCVDNIWKQCRVGGNCDTSICPLVAYDPNDKAGSGGFGSQAFIAAQQQLPYTINFENVPTATAVAQRIRITDQLDPNLDWRTFRLKEIGFGSYRITVPENRAFFQQRIQLGAEFNNLLADINAGVDIATGKVTWTLTAIDPATGEQPNGASLGLLPPNNADGDGQGFITYTVKSKANTPTGTLIRNNATIIFDAEEPITTNTVSNTLDADLPTSAVNALPPYQSQTTFTVSWAGQDPANGSGLQSYDVWVSENDAPYQPFLSGTTETSAQFTGQLNKTYRFYSIARDNAGNIESAPATPDATTRILGPTAAMVSVGGRVVTANGHGISKARITITDQNGETRTALTNGFGYYRFNDIPVGTNYIFGVWHKRFEFTAPSQVLFITEEREDINFTALN